MRTTVNIDESVLELAKRVAHERHCTLSEYLEESIQVNYARREQVRQVGYQPLRTFSGRLDPTFFKGDFTKTPDTSYVDENGLWHE